MSAGVVPPPTLGENPVGWALRRLAVEVHALQGAALPGREEKCGPDNAALAPLLDIVQGHSVKPTQREYSILNMGWPCDTLSGAPRPAASPSRAGRRVRPPPSRLALRPSPGSCSSRSAHRMGARPASPRAARRARSVPCTSRGRPRARWWWSRRRHGRPHRQPDRTRRCRRWRCESPPRRQGRPYSHPLLQSQSAASA